MAEVLSFVAPHSVNNVAFRSDAVIGFDSLPGSVYRVFLVGGNHVDIQGGQWEYEKLIKAMGQNE